MKSNIALRPLLLTVLAPVFWSTGGVGLRLADVSPWEVLFWRSLFMTMFLFSWSLLSGGKEVLSSYYRTVIRGRWVTLFFSLSLIFYVFSMSNTTVADSLLIQGTAPILIVVLGWIILGEPLKKMTLAALMVVCVGLLVIMVPSIEKGGLTGNFFGLAKAFAFAAGTIAIRQRKSVALLPAITTAAAFVTLTAAFFIPSFSIAPKNLLILAYLGFFQTGIAFVLFTTWSGKISSSITGLVVILEAVLGPIWVWLLLDERPPFTTLLGGAIIITALVSHTLLFYGGKEIKIEA